MTDSLSKSPVRGLEGTLLTSLSLSVCSSDPVVLVTKQHWYFPGYLDITLPLSAWFKNVALLVAKVSTCGDMAKDVPGGSYVNSAAACAVQSS